MKKVDFCHCISAYIQAVGTLIFLYSWFQIGFEVRSTKKYEYVTVELVRYTIALI